MPIIIKKKWRAGTKMLPYVVESSHFRSEIHVREANFVSFNLIKARWVVH